MNISNKISWLTRTAMLTALLITWQMFMGPATGNNQLIVGSGVNLILAVAVMTGGFGSGAAVGVLSPIFARFLGIGLMEAVPFIMLGNLAFAIVWHMIGNAKIGSKPVYAHVIAAVCAAFAKFLIIFLGVSYVVLPILLHDIPQQRADAIAATFGITQFITASIGGGVACVMLPLLRNALTKENV